MRAPGYLCKLWVGYLSVIGLLLICRSGGAHAQELLAGRWWHNERVVQRLGLTKEEVDALESAFRTTRRNLIMLKGKVEVAQFELETLLESPELDENAARAQYQRLEAARTALGTERFAFLLAVRRIVGYERFEKLMQFRRLAKQRKKQAAP
jgi:Spy/CpxP family protein refolding chaperone